MNPTETYYRVVDDSLLDSIPHARPTQFGENSSDGTLYAQGWARLWTDIPQRPGEYYELVQGSLVVTNDRVERADIWQEWDAAQKREAIALEVTDQVPDAPLKEAIRDPLIENDIARYSASATAKLDELENTDNADLDTFDATLDPASPQSDAVYSRVTASIIQLEPWAGAPDDIYGLKVELEVAGDPADGDAARVREVTPKTGPAGAVQVLVQDSENPQLWVYEQADGWKWADAEAQASVRLLWGTGSIPATPTMVCEGLYDRVSALVEYGTPASKNNPQAK